MQSRSISIGIDAAGAWRFVGDVPQGAACGCRCAACGAVLIAKQGDINAWHFAHEPGQERPDYVGAVNLLRALVIEQLHERLQRPLPTYRASVRLSFPFSEQHERFEWEPGAAAAVQRPTHTTQNAPVALVRLASGTQVFVFVTINGEGEPHAVGQRDGLLLLDVPLPLEAAQLKNLAQAKRYIDEAGRFEWLALPDAEAAKADKLQAMKQAAHAQQEAAAARMRVQHEAGAQRLRALQQEFQARQRAAEPELQAAPAAEPQPVESPWAWRKQPSSFLYYELRDSSRWVMVTHQDDRSVLAPWPPADDGWDEALPPRLGPVDLALGGLVLRDATETMLYLRDLVRVTRTTSSWSDLVEYVQERAARDAPG